MQLAHSFMIACVVTGTVGCRSEKSDKEKAREDFRAAWAHRTPPQAAEHPTSMVVAQGASPLVFQVQEPCTVHIIDATTGAEVASGAAKKQGLVYVSEETGAFINGDRVAPGPFNPGHQSAISGEVGRDESWCSRVRVEPAPKPAASQPGGLE